MVGRERPANPNRRGGLVPADRLRRPGHVVIEPAPNRVVEAIDERQALLVPVHLDVLVHADTLTLTAIS